MNIFNYVQDVLNLLKREQWGEWFNGTDADMFMGLLDRSKSMEDLLYVINLMMTKCINVDDNGNLILLELTTIQLSILKEWHQ